LCDEIEQADDGRPHEYAHERAIRTKIVNAEAGRLGHRARYLKDGPESCPESTRYAKNGVGHVEDDEVKGGYLWNQDPSINVRLA
jgi:hypothetical protein